MLSQGIFQIRSIAVCGYVFCFYSVYVCLWLTPSIITDEELMLYDACEKFCKMASDSKTTLGSLQNLGHHIVTTFINDEARYAVDLPAALKQEALHCDNIKEYSKQTFERIRTLVFRELKLNFYHAFIKRFASIAAGDVSRHLL